MLKGVLKRRKMDNTAVKTLPTSPILTNVFGSLRNEPPFKEPPFKENSFFSIDCSSWYRSHRLVSRLQTLVVYDVSMLHLLELLHEW
mmetsp:Transcript_26833/g.40775  ORF Transcript_26833/g.40775 Transcript_26833/m.40775 type:complete len:87 (+) Transcript_26833:185-445(+)